MVGMSGAEVTSVRVPGLAHPITYDPALPISLWREEIARTIAGNAPLSTTGMKLISNNVLLDPAERDMAAVDQAVLTCFDSVDYTEGRTAFMEKRKPNFKRR